MKTSIKAACAIAAMVLLIPAVAVRADTSYVGATVGTTYTYHWVVGSGSSAVCYAWTMTIAKITDDPTGSMSGLGYPDAQVNVTVTTAYLLWSGKSTESIYVPADSNANDMAIGYSTSYGNLPQQQNASALNQYVVNKNIANMTYCSNDGTYKYTRTHDSNGVMSSWVWAYSNGTQIEAIISGAGTGCTALGTGLLTPGYDTLIIAAIVTLGIAIIAIRMRRRN